VIQPRWVPVLTFALTAVFFVSALSIGEFNTRTPAVDTALLVVNTLPLLLLRRNPLLVLAIFSVAYPSWIIAGHEGHLLQSLPSVTAMFALGAWERPLWMRALGLITPIWMLSAALVGWWEADPLELGYVAIFFVVVWALGVTLAARRRYVEVLEERTAQLGAAQAELAERAVADERIRIARELHDVVAHAMSVITVQAGVASHLAETQPHQAAEALGIIERTGREALDEMRRMLKMLREPDDQTGLQPGVAGLSGLVSRLSETGVPVTLSIRGKSRRVPPGIDFAAYRVVQEALTNVVKHAPGARADVTVAYLPDSLEITVMDHGRPALGSPDPGHGLAGMEERVELYGGKLTAEGTHEGFHVRATFPLEEDR